MDRRAVPDRRLPHEACSEEVRTGTAGGDQSSAMANQHGEQRERPESYCQKGDESSHWPCNSEADDTKLRTLGPSCGAGEGMSKVMSDACVLGEKCHILTWY